MPCAAHTRAGARRRPSAGPPVGRSGTQSARIRRSVGTARAVPSTHPHPGGRTILLGLLSRTGFRGDLDCQDAVLGRGDPAEPCRDRGSIPRSCSSAVCGWRSRASVRSRTLLPIWGSAPETLRKRVRQAEADAGLRPDLPTSEEREEIKRLRQENFELRRANEILKSASVFFAKELDPDRPK